MNKKIKKGMFITFIGSSTIYEVYDVHKKYVLVKDSESYWERFEYIDKIVHLRSDMFEDFNNEK